MGADFGPVKALGLALEEAEDVVEELHLILVLPHHGHQCVIVLSAHLVRVKRGNLPPTSKMAGKRGVEF